MRALVFLLVFANLLFYAFSAGYFGSPGSDDARRLAQQVHPERLRIVSRGEAPAAAEESKPLAADPALSGGDKPAVLGCLLWEGLGEAEAGKLGEWLASKFPEFRVERLGAGEAAARQWWVYIPPLSNKAESERKAGQLRTLGINDYFIVNDGAQRFAISLGIFSAESRAEERLAELKAKGVRSARVGERPGRETSLGLRLRGPQAQQPALLAALGEGGRSMPQNCP
ncbi:SPOR domain-containing protein [Dechloromonas sp. ZY10]|uniref:SPOR domain-containing protein n=1 Tax=Dechloromonas aquae TaxID=2664436 RepID=UPI00352738F1